MDKPETKPSIPAPRTKTSKPLSRGGRIHRRRTLSLERRTKKAEAVTTRPVIVSPAT